MPGRLKCEACKAVLKSWPALPPHFYERKSKSNLKESGKFWYLELYESLKGTCPSCGHELMSPKHFREEARIAVSIIQKALVVAT